MAKVINVQKLKNDINNIMEYYLETEYDEMFEVDILDTLEYHNIADDMQFVDSFTDMALEKLMDEEYVSLEDVALKLKEYRG